MAFANSWSGEIGEPSATPVKLDPDSDDYFAVLVGLEQWDRSVLYVYDSDHDMVNQEIFPSSGAAVLAFPNQTGDGEVLLVGLENRVVEFKLSE